MQIPVPGEGNRRDPAVATSGRRFLLVLLVAVSVPLADVYSWSPRWGGSSSSTNHNNHHGNNDQGIARRRRCLVAHPERPRRTAHPVVAGSSSTPRRHHDAFQPSATQGSNDCDAHDATSPSSSGANSSSSSSSSSSDDRPSHDERLLGPAATARLDLLVELRSRARWGGDYGAADALRDQIDAAFAAAGPPPGCVLLLRDHPRTGGGGSTWRVECDDGGGGGPEAYVRLRPPGPTVLELAHEALGLAASSAVEPSSDDRRGGAYLDSIVGRAEARLGRLLGDGPATSSSTGPSLRWMVPHELGGRKAADAAFWFALAGTTNGRLLSRLADVAASELGRFGARPTCRARDVRQILGRFDAAGVGGHRPLRRVVRHCLALKEGVEEARGDDIHDDDARSVGEDGGDDTDTAASMAALHSDRSLLLVWKFSTKQKKQKAFLNLARRHWGRHQGGTAAAAAVTDGENEDSAAETSDLSDPAPPPTFGAGQTNFDALDWSDIFEDPSRPLVVDVGCGMGVSLLGLASGTDESAPAQASSRLLLLGGGDAQDGQSSTGGGSLTWSDCNFVGIDLSDLAVGYARGISRRWGLHGRLHFAVGDAEGFCRHGLPSYPGDVRLCMIQFPTPYRLATSTSTAGGGNSQLPPSQADGFMVTRDLLESIRARLHPTRGRLLLQSNCEDVAVWMRNLACDDVGFLASPDTYSTGGAEGDVPPTRVPQRTVDWRAMGGERAEGQGWFRRPVLHRDGATETEVACSLNGTPVHRCLLQLSRHKGLMLQP